MSKPGTSTPQCKAPAIWRVCGVCLASVLAVGCGSRGLPVSSARAAEVDETSGDQSAAATATADERPSSAAALVEGIADGEDLSTALPLAAITSLDGAANQQYVTATLRGRIVWMYPALKARYGMGAVREATERVLALEADDGQLYPIFEDARGRAFRVDPRLRDRPVELLVRWRPSVHMMQVVRLWFVKPDGRYAIDYWCDVCAISMIEDGPCDCCQDHNRLRERLD